MKPPWRSRPIRVELQLVTSHLVVALKAASTASDQHKIAFTIQELLAILDKTASEGDSQVIKETSRKRNAKKINATDASDCPTKQKMSNWLVSKLVEANVFEIIEPFWFTEFHEVRFHFVRVGNVFSLSSPVVHP